jgi:hypothetical protein
VADRFLATVVAWLLRETPRPVTLRGPYGLTVRLINTPSPEFVDKHYAVNRLLIGLALHIQERRIWPSRTEWCEGLLAPAIGNRGATARNAARQNTNAISRGGRIPDMIQIAARDTAHYRKPAPPGPEGGMVSNRSTLNGKCTLERTVSPPRQCFTSVTLHSRYQRDATRHPQWTIEVRRSS